MGYLIFLRARAFRKFRLQAKEGAVLAQELEIHRKSRLRLFQRTRCAFVALEKIVRFETPVEDVFLRRLQPTI